MKMIKSIILFLRGIFNYQPRTPLSEEDKTRQITIYPYCKDGEWMFDDPSVGLKEEPLVLGVPEMIDLFRKKKGIKKEDIKIVFSASDFPKSDLKLKQVRTQDGGNWYYAPKLKMECWLCPALFCYYPSAPKELYVGIFRS